MDWLFYVATVTLLAMIGSIITLEVGKRSIKFLKDVQVSRTSNFPRISVVIPARNEEKNLEEALTSVLCQDYDRIEVIAIDDRSTDRTSSILDRLGEHYHKLRVFHIDNLPVGWLGKNHALYHGAQHANGELLLFADADIVMEPTVLRRAVIYMQENRLDHLVVGAHLRINGVLLKMMVLSFVTSFMLFFMPWRAKVAKSRRFTGGGSFSLFSREVYEAVGTMRVLATRVDDDLRLGKRIKEHGFRQEFMAGANMLFVEWYSSARGMIEGLTKNSFAVLEFSPLRTTALSLLSFLYYVWPLIAIFLTGGWTQMLNVCVVLLTVILYGSAAKFVQLPAWYALGFPLAVSIHIFILLRSAWVTLSKGGITWRETFYPMSELSR
jgi:cellulose synthase/poly-beta-1,6-N-acetylglucosamine synthase-like glycosyltransferase